MESHMLLGFVTTPREALNIFYKNGKLIASFTLLTLSLYSILYLFNFFSMKPLITNWIINQSLLLFTSPNSPEYANLLVAMNKDIRIFVGVEWIFILIGSIISFFFSIATILASATTQNGKILSLQDLLSTTAGSLIRPITTLLYITLFGVGYIFLSLIILLPLMMAFQRPFALKLLYILLSASIAVFYAYLAVVWTLALVISVLEDNYGIEALGKAAKIVKGMELHGFLVNILVTILSFVLLLGFSHLMLTFKQLAAVQATIGLLMLISLWLVRMFGLTAYTVFYYQCKKSHGEEFELEGSMKSSKILTVPLIINENIP